MAFVESDSDGGQGGRAADRRFGRSCRRFGRGALVLHEISYLTGNYDCVMEYHITLPSKPRIVSEEGLQGVYEIDSLYPGYGHTLGNSLRRIILSSLPGASITQVKIEGVPHEFATMDGVRETVMEILLNLKRVHFMLHGDEPQIISLSVKGTTEVTAENFKLPSQVEIKNPSQHIADLSGKASLEIEATIERGLGYVPREVLANEKVDIGKKRAEFIEIAAVVGVEEPGIQARDGLHQFGARLRAWIGLCAHHKGRSAEGRQQ